MVQSFSNLLSDYRSRSRTPDGSGPLTTVQLANQMERASGLKVDPKEIEEWQAGAPPGPDQRDLVLALIQTLRESGAVDDMNQADELLQAAGQKPLSEEEGRRLFFVLSGAVKFGSSQSVQTKNVEIPIAQQVLEKEEPMGVEIGEIRSESEPQRGEEDLSSDSGYQEYPTFIIEEVHRDSDVTIMTQNLPPNDSFDVLMGQMGTRGVNGIKVDEVRSDEGGSQKYKFSIPEGLFGQNQIAVRLQSNTSGFYAFNWFYNRTGSDPTLTEPPAETEQPDRLVEFSRNGTLIRVALTQKGWRLPVEGLVVGLAGTKSGKGVYTFTGPGGQFYQACIEAAGPALAQKLTDRLRKQIPDGLRYDHPAAFALDQDMLPELLPFAPEGKGWIILGTLRDEEGEMRLEHIAPFMSALLDLMRSEGIGHIALPLLGTSSGQPTPVEVAQEMLNALIGGANLSKIESVTLLTISPAVCEAAQRKLNLLLSNRSQPLRNDEPAAQDLLGIDFEVKALAETLLQRDVIPPIAVGIMGGWGSGKSTVMRLMQNHMTGVRLKPVTKGYPDDPGEGEPPSFVGHVYQVGFNAWTYAKSNLWASLMQTVFYEINRQLSLEKQLAKDNPPMEGGKEYRLLYSQYARADDNALWDILRQRQDEQLKDLQKQEKQIAEVKAQRDQQRETQQKQVMQGLGEEARQEAVGVLQKKIRAVVGTIQPELVKTLLSQPELDEGQVEELFDSLRSLQTTLGKLIQAARSGGVWTASLFLFGLLTLGGAYLLTILPGLPWWGELAAWLAAVMPWALPILRTARKWAQWVDDRQVEHQAMVEKEREKWQVLREERLAKMQAEEDKQVKTLLARQDLTPEAKDAQLRNLAEAGNLAAYETILAQMEARAEALRRQVGPAASYVSLLDFVQSRLDEATYEKELGLMHQIKLDIDHLTDGLMIQPWDSPGTRLEKKKEFPRGAPRVVLYIDDLDRCPPPRVVEVMEAVQLLLNTRLFVVVLGLDTRYVTRALEKEYKEILQHEGDPSGLDYIEKIIQIPYRLRPIESSSLSTFLEAQMEFVEEETPQITVDDNRHVPENEETPPESDEETNPDLNSPEGQQPEPSEESLSLLEDLPPGVVKFQREDLQDLTACCRQVNLTPRSISRLVNVLKLVKIFWFRSLGHDRPRKVQRTVISLLALSAAYPEIMREAFAHLESRFRAVEKLDEGSVNDFLAEFGETQALQVQYAWQVERYKADVKALSRVVLIENEPPVCFGEITLKELTLITLNLVRSFSFVGDPSFSTDNHDVKGGVP